MYLLQSLLPVAAVPTNSAPIGVIPKKRGQPSSAQPVVKKLFKGKNKNVDDRFILDQSDFKRQASRKVINLQLLLLLLKVLFYLKLEEKLRALEEEKIHLEAKLKKEQEEALNLLRKS
ncbi:hypothetical protein GUJ93_ZPchr0014g47071 [Zizania palustris]|uniref:Uncharacterized protein n=1 Tax=Zizania palustris TaxID=103762 RepID=A0A8J5W5M6_ZIZPA|nr:hypothetical protein GUJ93_ZPchr0014g47071 [Zizania palustris]